MPLVFLVLSPSKTLSNLELMLQGESASSDYIIPTQIIRSQTSFSNHFINLWLRRILDFSFLSPLWSKLIHLSFTIMSFTGFSTIIIISTSQTLGSSGGSDGKESACNAGDLSSIPGLGRFPGEGNGNPLQYCLENHKDRGAWKATVHGVTKSQTRLSNFSLHFTPRLNKIHPAGWWVGVLEGRGIGISGTFYFL